MFNNTSKSKELLNHDDKNEDKVVHDFVTHNMPAPHRFSGQTFSNGSATKRDKAISGPDNGSHQKIGLLIIGGGLILIVILFYFGYSYFIKPVINQSNIGTNLNNNTVTETPVTTTTTTATITEATTPVENIATETPVISTSTATTTASSTDITFPEETPVISTPVAVSTVDSDADGLTDAEEKIVGTDPNKADTDNDGYSDLAELKSGYDPLVPGAKVASSSKMYDYQIDSKATVIYPATWDVTKSDVNSTVIFADSDKAFIQVTYQNNPGKINPKVWYAQQFSGMTPGESISGDFWQGFYSQDGLAAYVFNKDLSKIYSFSCAPLTSDTSSVTLFHLMMKTLVIK
jgi:hypothetical protein